MTAANRFRLFPALAICITFALGSSAVRAQTAGMMSFQGYIKNAAGVPVNGTVDLLFDVRSSTASLATFNVNGVAATAGVVTTKYGPLAPASFDGTSRLLRVTVTPVSPPGAAFTLADVEIVTPPAIAEQLNAQGTGNPAIMTDVTGRVGIGTTPSLHKLSVQGNISTAGPENGLIFPHWEVHETSPDEVLRFSSTSDHVVISPSGKVGIGLGNNLPLEALHIGGGPAGQTIQLGTYASAGAVYGAGSALLGNNVKSDDNFNRLVYMVDQGQMAGGRAIELNQDLGITFYTTALGAGAGQTFSDRNNNQNERMRITNAGNVGIGTAAPSARFQVEDSGTNQEIALFNGAGDSSDTTAYVFIHNTRNGQPISWGLAAHADGHFGIHQSGGPGDRIHIATNGNVGIGTATPSERLHVAGNICATGTIGVCSDARLKANVESIHDSLDSLEKLRAVRFDWRCAEYPDRNFEDTPQIGFIAQEMLEVVPEVVQQGSDGYYSVDYGRLTPVLTAAMQEMHALVRKLETAGQEKDAEIAALRATAARQQTAIDELARRLERLEAANVANGGGK